MRWDLYKFFPDFDCEKSSKIGQYLMKLVQKCAKFLGRPVRTSRRCR